MLHFGVKTPKKAFFYSNHRFNIWYMYNQFCCRCRRYRIQNNYINNDIDFLKMQDQSWLWYQQYRTHKFDDIDIHIDVYCWKCKTNYVVNIHVIIHKKTILTLISLKTINDVDIDDIEHNMTISILRPISIFALQLKYQY